MASLSVDLPADVKKEAVKTSGVVRCDKQVEVVLRNSKINGTGVQKPAAQWQEPVFVHAWLGSRKSQSHGNCYFSTTHRLDNLLIALRIGF